MISISGRQHSSPLKSGVQRPGEGAADEGTPTAALACSVGVAEEAARGRRSQDQKMVSARPAGSREPERRCGASATRFCMLWLSRRKAWARQQHDAGPRTGLHLETAGPRRAVEVALQPAFRSLLQGRRAARPAAPGRGGRGPSLHAAGRRRDQVPVQAGSRWPRGPNQHAAAGSRESRLPLGGHDDAQPELGQLLGQPHVCLPPGPAGKVVAGPGPRGFRPAPSQRERLRPDPALAKRTAMGPSCGRKPLQAQGRRPRRGRPLSEFFRLLSAPASNLQRRRVRATRLWARPLGAPLLTMPDKPGAVAPYQAAAPQHAPDLSVSPTDLAPMADARHPIVGPTLGAPLYRCPTSRARPPHTRRPRRSVRRT